MSNCWVNVQIMSDTGKCPVTTRERCSLFMCVHIFLMDLMDTSFDAWDLLICKGTQKRALSLASRRVFMQGFHVVFQEKNVLPHKYHLLLSMRQGFGNELRARRTAQPWTISCRALEAHSSRMTGGWLFLARLSPDNWGEWLLPNGLLVLYSFFLDIEKGAIWKFLE